jgi:hypothetical protein
VEAALELLLSNGSPITSVAVKALVQQTSPALIPELPAPDVDLAAYDGLLAEVGT